MDRPYDIDAVARTRSRVIDGALTLLGLARIEPERDRAFRVAGVRRQLENHLGFGHRVPVRTE